MGWVVIEICAGDGGSDISRAGLGGGVSNIVLEPSPAGMRHP